MTVKGGQRLLSVDELLQAQGISADLSNVRPEVQERSARRTAAIHAAFDMYDDGAALPDYFTEDEEQFDLSAEVQAYADLHLPVIASNYLVTDGKRVAGIVDKVIATEVKNEVIIGIIKTEFVVARPTAGWKMSVLARLFGYTNSNKITVRDICAIHVRNGKPYILRLPRHPNIAVDKLLYCQDHDLEYKDDIKVGGRLADILGGDEAARLNVMEGEFMRLEQQYRTYEGVLKEMRDKVAGYMTERGLRIVRLPDGSHYTLQPEAVRVNINKEKLADEYPDAYEHCVTRTPLPAFLRWEDDAVTVMRKNSALLARDKIIEENNLEGVIPLRKPFIKNK